MLACAIPHLYTYSLQPAKKYALPPPSAYFHFLNSLLFDFSCAKEKGGVAHLVAFQVRFILGFDLGSRLAGRLNLFR